MAITIRKSSMQASDSAAAAVEGPVLVDDAVSNTGAAIPQRKKSTMELAMSIIFAVLGFSAVIMVAILIVFQINENAFYAAPESLWPSR